MYSEQVAKLQSLFGVDTASPQGQMLEKLYQMSVMGNCAQDLTHRAPITIVGDLTDAPEVCPNQIDVTDGRELGDGMPAMLKVIGRGVRSPDTGCVRNGYTAAFFGPVHFSDPLSVGSKVWMRAATNWSNSIPPGGGARRVDCYLCDNAAGDNTDTSRAYAVYFSWDRNRSERPYDPNIEWQETLTVYKMPDGTYWTDDGQDAAISQTIDANDDLDIGGGTAPGWGLADGSGNAASAGGTGINETGRFSRMAFGAGAYALNGQGGSETHDHDFTTDLATTGITASFAAADALAAISATVSASAIVATIQSITSSDIAALLENHTCAEVAACLADHDLGADLDDHTAAQVYGCLDVTGNDADQNLDGTTVNADTVNAGTAPLEHVGTSAHTAAVSGQDLQHTGVSAATYSLAAVGAATAAVSFAVVLSTVAVAISEGSGHQHTGTTDSGGAVPPYTNKNRYERLDNSHETVVANVSGGGTYPYGYVY